MAKIQMQSKTKRILSIRIFFFQFFNIENVGIIFQKLAKLVELI